MAVNWWSLLVRTAPTRACARPRRRLDLARFADPFWVRDRARCRCLMWARASRRAREASRVATSVQPSVATTAAVLTPTSTPTPAPAGLLYICGLGQAVAGAAETVRGTLRVAGNGAGDSRAQRLGSGEHAAGGLAFGVDRTRASPWRLRQGPLEPLRGNVVGSFLDTLTVLPPRGAPAEQ